MKPVLPFVAAVALMTACNSKPDTSHTAATPTDTIKTDTTGLAQFQAWKAQHELDSVANYNPQATATVTHAVHSNTATHRRSGARSVNTQNGAISSESANTAKAPAKKGWSKAAKGTAIGAGTGAVIGAVVHKKNRVVGGVVGGVAGGAVGYGIGRHMDKKDGRY